MPVGLRSWEEDIGKYPAYDFRCLSSTHHMGLQCVGDQTVIRIRAEVRALLVIELAEPTHPGPG